MHALNTPTIYFHDLSFFFINPEFGAILPRSFSPTF